MFEISNVRRIAEAGRLFPNIEIGAGWSVSAQADRAGYGCTPRDRLPRLDSYEKVEVLIRGPMAIVDAHNLGLPEDLAVFFPHLKVGDWNTIAHDFPIARLSELCESIMTAAMKNPNAGIPPGSITWPGQTVYHGTSAPGADSILDRGIRMRTSGRGYFGQAFYVADDQALARSNYANFSDDEGRGAVLSFTLTEDARILDMRNAEDARVWKESGLETSDPQLASRATALEIDGIYDRSVGGLAIYNAATLVFTGFAEEPEHEGSFDI